MEWLEWLVGWWWHVFSNRRSALFRPVFLVVCAGLPYIGRIMLQIAALTAPFFIFLQGGF